MLGQINQNPNTKPGTTIGKLENKAHLIKVSIQKGINTSLEANQ